MFKMKESGIDWIGEIPEHWDIRKLSHVCETITDFTASGSFADLAANVKYLDTEDYARLIRTADLSGKRDIKPVYVNEHAYNYLSNSNLFGGEVILPNIGASIGDVYRYMPIYERATLAPNSIMLRSKGINEYLYYLFYTNQFRNFINLESSSTAQGKFNKTQLRAFKVPVPPIEEQQAIVNTLNQICGTLDNTKSDIEKQIEILQDYKKSIITEAVTKGLDKNVELKDSGIDWIEEVPEYWYFMKLKNLYSFRTGLSISKSDLIEEGIPVLNYGQIHAKDNLQYVTEDNFVRYVDNKHINIKSAATFGDFIFADTSEDIVGCGNNNFIDDINKVIYAGYHTNLLKCNNDNNGKYFAYLFTTDNWRSQIRRKVAGIKVYSITQAILKNVYVTIPPIEEQEEIVKYLDDKCSKIDSIIETKKQQIETLEEYKKSIIYEYVTGKRTV